MFSVPEVLQLVLLALVLRHGYAHWAEQRAWRQRLEQVRRKHLMPFDIGGALQKGRTLHTIINLEGISGGLPLDYYPNKADDAQAALLELNERGGTKEERFAGMAAILFDLMPAWEASVDGVPVPLSLEGFQEAGITTPFIISLVGAIIGEAYSGEASGTRLQKRLRNS